ncbi:DUF11 domain-containing protein [Candidatus Parcubacteria bacterium]|nr:DUF11 domain-containing protein [Candidatus Parcubacteria bacterium]
MTIARKSIILSAILFAALTASALFGVAAAHAQTSSTLTCTGVTLSGSVFPNGASTNAWFEWGTTQSLGTQTAAQAFTANSNFTSSLTGLTPSTTYYYRAVAQNVNGIAYSPDLSQPPLSFSTPSCQPAGTAPTVTTNSANVLGQNAATLSGTVNGNGQATTAWFEWGTSPSFGNTTSQQTFGTGISNTTFTVSSLSPNTTYYYRAVAQNASGTVQGATLSFTTQGTTVTQTPTVTGSSSLTCNSVTLSGTVFPGSVSTQAWFEWGTSQSFGNQTPSQTFTTTSNFIANLTGLQPNTTYYYRAVAQNQNGTAQSQTLSFVTPQCSGGSSVPTVTTNSANVLSQNAATLNGSVNGNGQTTTAWFEWGTTQSFGNTTSQQTFGTGFSNVTFTISSLSPNTTYYYRAVAQNSAGTSQGSTLSFTTQGTTGGNGSMPTVTTNSANVQSQNSVTLNGFANGNGLTTNAWFEWGTSQSFGNTTSQSFTGANGQSYSYTLTNLNQNSTYYYRAVAQNSAGIAYGNTQTFTTSFGGCQFNCGNNNNTQPFVATYSANGIGDSFAVLNGNLVTNGQIATRWFEWGTSQGYLGNSTVKLTQSFDGNFSQTVTGLSSNTTYYFRAVAQGSFGQVYGNIITFTTTGFGSTNNNCYINGVYQYNCGTNNNNNCYVNGVYQYNCGQNNQNALQVITTLATNVGQTSARLNGLALINQGASTQAWFEWGSTSGLGNTTVTQDVGTAPSSSFYASLFGLQSGRTYYYRAVATNAIAGTVRGDLQSFTTASPSTTTYTPPTTTTTVVVGTGTGKPALVSLSIDRNGACNYRGQTVEYVVTYKNTSQKNLKDVVLRVLVPDELTFGNSTLGNYSTADRNVVVTLGALAPGQEGSIRVSVAVANSATLGKAMVVTAHLVDTDTATGAQEEVVAYSVNNACDDGSLQSASSFFGGVSFLPDSLLEWLLLILVILALVILVRNIYGNRPPQP